MIVNRQNFIRWSDSAPGPVFPDLPHAYWKDRGACGYMPILVQGETLSFYINTAAGLVIAGAFSDLRIDIVRAKDNVVVSANVGGLSQHYLNYPVNSGNYNIYGTFTVPSLPAEVYYLKIYKNTGGAEVVRSSYLRARTDTAEVLDTTTYAKFKHDRFYYNIKYHEIPAFYQQFRLDINLTDEQYETDDEIYRPVTTGVARTFETVIDRVLKLETYYFDREAHEAMAVMVQHSHLELNGKQYKKKAGYKITADVRSKFAKGEVELWDSEFASVNRC